VSASWTQREAGLETAVSVKHRSVFDMQKSPLGSANMVAKKEKEKKKEKKKERTEQEIICPFTS
jgi:hypothetical protein